MKPRSPIRKKRPGVRRGPWRSPAYRRWISHLPCCLCTRNVIGMLRLAGFTDIVRSDPAHTGKDGGMSMKSSDASVIPLCRMHHDMLDGRQKTPAGEVGRESFVRYFGLPIEDIVIDLNLVWKEKTGKAVGS